MRNGALVFVSGVELMGEVDNEFGVRDPDVAVDGVLCGDAIIPV